MEQGSTGVRHRLLSDDTSLCRSFFPHRSMSTIDINRIPSPSPASLAPPHTSLSKLGLLTGSVRSLLILGLALSLDTNDYPKTKCCPFERLCYLQLLPLGLLVIWNQFSNTSHPTLSFTVTLYPHTQAAKRIASRIKLMTLRSSLSPPILFS